MYAIYSKWLAKVAKNTFKQSYEFFNLNVFWTQAQSSAILTCKSTWISVLVPSKPKLYQVDYRFWNWKKNPPTTYCNSHRCMNERLTISTRKISAIYVYMYIFLYMILKWLKRNINSINDWYLLRFPPSIRKTT